ncbi:DUF998 domain-containing protein [Microbacterium gorillae]|uniref:DUF998 domain-containing protein n=1 Tax=Microbacterium gorillae TaxID=1231063 RepID=UPI000693B90B|nr:DUF998 domain-containing protein [Microbacterium gorillae]
MANSTTNTRDRVSDRLALGALIGLLTATGAILLLHVLPPTAAIDPIRVTVSEYGRTSLAWLFNGAVLLLAASSVAALAALVRRGFCRPVSVPSLLMLLWVVGLIGVAVFTKADWATGATWTGLAHRAMAVMAFVSLPIAVLIIATRRLRSRPPRRMSTPLMLAVFFTLLAIAAVVGLGVFVGIGEAVGFAWWTMIPLGLIERTLILAELAALAMLLLETRRPMIPLGLIERTLILAELAALAMLLLETRRPPRSRHP